MNEPAARRRTWCLNCSGYIKRERGSSEYCSPRCMLEGMNKKRAMAAVAKRAQRDAEEFGTMRDAEVVEPEKVPLALAERWLTLAARL